MNEAHEKKSVKRGRFAWLRRLFGAQADAANGDSITTTIGSGARNVTVGKNIIVIGNLTISRALLLWILAGLFAVLAAVGVAVFNTLPEAPIYTQMNGRFNIAVAKFGYRDADGKVHENSLGDRLSEWLAKTLSNELNSESQPGNPSLTDFLVWHDATQPASNPKIGFLASDEEAETVQANLVADMVVFGYLDQENDPASLQLHFVYRRPDIGQEPDGDIGRKRLGGSVVIPKNYADKFGDNVDDPFYLRSQAIIWLARGLTKEFHGDYAGALAAFRSLDDRLPKLDSGQEIFYYFQGREAFQLRHLKEAESSFQLALHSAQAQGHEYVTAYLGLGNVNLERAQLGLLFASDAGLDVQACQSISADNEPTPLLDAIDLARDAGDISATPAQMITDATKAFHYYELGAKYSERGEWQPAHNVAQYLQANSLRTRADIYLFNEDVNRAEADAKAAVIQFENVRPRFEAEKEFGFLAYSDYSLGLAQRTLSIINAGRGDYGQAHTDLDHAITNLQQCQTYEDQPDGDGDVHWQAQVACYCRDWQQRLTTKKQDLPLDTGGKG